MGAAQVRMNAPGVDLYVPLGEGSPVVTGGFSNIEAVERPDNIPLTQWRSGTLLALDVPVLLDGFADDADQQPLLDQIIALAITEHDPPTPFTATGPIPFAGTAFVIDGIDWGDSARNEFGVLIRQALTLSFLQWVDPDVLELQRRKSGAPAKASGGQRTYTVKKGDTLHTIAAKVLGSASRWKEIGDLNGIRDPRKALSPGRTLRLPT